MIPLNRRYEQLIQDLRSELRPQREWAENRGLFLVIGHFLVGVAGGTWLCSLLFELRGGLAVAFCLGVLGGLSHLAFLGRPERFWKMALHVRTSWISRGFWGLSLFLIGGVLYLVPQFLPGAPWRSGSVPAAIGYVVSLIGMVGIIGYMGFVYSSSRAIPFWNSPTHPLLYIAYALRGGMAVLLIILMFEGRSPDATLTAIKVWLVVTTVVVVLYLFEIYGAVSGHNPAARQSVRDLLFGRVAVYFYGGTLLIGILIPAMLVSGFVFPLSMGTLAIIGFASVIGDFFMKYTTIKAGVYMPLYPRVTRQVGH
ncbi:MAG: polysulfide reductase NrfD [Alphaproteobacteria bacterium]|nr:polysulfide reductase NrfD [Alphaproteobacteria bacterium]